MCQQLLRFGSKLVSFLLIISLAFLYRDIPPVIHAVPNHIIGRNEIAGDAIFPCLGIVMLIA